MISKEKLLKAASVMVSAAGLALTMATTAGDFAANLDHRLDRLEQSVAALSAEVKLLDRAAHPPRVR
jgi:DNA-binding MurR/RpiR family transcriptional regulator